MKYEIKSEPQITFTLTVHEAYEFAKDIVLADEFSNGNINKISADIVDTLEEFIKDNVDHGELLIR